MGQAVGVGRQTTFRGNLTFRRRQRIRRARFTYIRATLRTKTAFAADSDYFRRTFEHELARKSQFWPSISPTFPILTLRCTRGCRQKSPLAEPPVIAPPSRLRTSRYTANIPPFGNREYLLRYRQKFALFTASDRRSCRRWNLHTPLNVWW